MKTRRCAVALATVAFVVFGGVATAMHAYARTSNAIIWCDGVDDDVDDTNDAPSCAATESDTLEDSSPPEGPGVRLHVGEGSPGSRDVHQACEAGAEASKAMPLLFRPRRCHARCSPRNDSPIPH